MAKAQDMDKKRFFRPRKIDKAVEAIAKSLSYSRFLEELSDPNGRGARRVAAVMLPPEWPLDQLSGGAHKGRERKRARRVLWNLVGRDPEFVVAVEMPGGQKKLLAAAKKLARARDLESEDDVTKYIHDALVGDKKTKHTRR